MPDAPDYPEHAKLTALNHKTEAVNDFLEWVRAEHPGTYLAREIDGAGDFGMRSLSRNEYDNLLAGWIGVDLKALGREKSAMIEAMRAMNGAPT